jgi:hypothetical protein
MNHKRGVVALLIAFVVIFCFEFLWHGVLMKSAYMETAALWRTNDDFMRHLWVLVVGHAVVAFAFTGLYISKVGLQSAATGLGYGIVIGIFCAGGCLIRYATEPVTIRILWMWIGGGVIEFAIVGALVGAIYTPLSASATRNSI